MIQVDAPPCRVCGAIMIRVFTLRDSPVDQTWGCPTCKAQHQLPIPQPPVLTPREALTLRIESTARNLHEATKSVGLHPLATRAHCVLLAADDYMESYNIGDRELQRRAFENLRWATRLAKDGP